MPASMTTWRPPRSRTCRTRATSQPDRATSARPGSMARRAGRRPSGTLARRSGSSRANRSGAGHRLVLRQDREAAADVERVERVEVAAQEADHREPAPHRVAPGVDRARAATRRGGGPRAAGSRRPRASPSHSTRPVASVSVMPNLDAAIADGQPGDRLRRDLGVEPDQHVERRPAAPPQTGAAGHRGQRPRPRPADSRATHSSGFAPAAVERIAARRSASVLPTPSREIRSSGTPARRATAHSPRDTTLAPKPRDVDLGHDRGDVVGLDRVLPDPRIGERRPHGRCRPVQLGEVGHIGRRAVPAGDVAESGRDRVRNGRGDGVLSRGRQAGLPC